MHFSPQQHTEMDAAAMAGKKPHVIFIPYPLQSHIKAMLKLAQLLHHKGLQITFVNTDFNHRRFLKSGGPHSLDGSPGFRFAAISDGIPRSDDEAPYDVHQVLQAIETNLLAPFLDLAIKLETPPTCIISDGFMSAFTIDAAGKLRIPIMLCWTLAAGSFMGLYQMKSLREKGLTPLKDESYLTNGYLDTVVDWIPGMKEIRLKNLPAYVRTTDPNHKLFNFTMEATQRSNQVSHNIIHTFNDLELSLVEALSSMFHHVYTVGPLQLLLNQVPKEKETNNSSNYSLWKEEPKCIKWLESKDPNSVVYVNFGSIAVMSLQDLIEFGWGLANSNHHFLWIIRSDLVLGESAVFSREFEDRVKDKGFIASWCSQEQVLNHPSVGGFLTHGGWGSTIESLSAGVPMICRPFFSDQPTNCRYICKEWEVGMEMGSEVKRDEVEKLVRELMGGGTCGVLKKKAMEWKKKADMAAQANGSSSLNVDKLIKEIAILSTT